MKKVILNLSDRNWVAGLAQRFFVKGRLSLDKNNEEIGRTFAASIEAGKLESLLPKINGFYSCIYRTDSQLVACVDHVRSRPLFYAHVGDKFYLSDNAEWVRVQAGDTDMDPIAREEFLLAGYVTGPNTLYATVKQLQAGEYLHVTTNDDRLSVTTKRYYRFDHVEPVTYNEEQLIQQLEDCTLKAMHRLIAYAAGRQLVIPLSGGYDSRLIVSMLKRLGYTNVLCFTYGVPGNKEALYSKKVANDLGFEWTFVEYSERRWKDAWRTQEAEEYRAMAANHTSLPHVQDWLAIRELIFDGRISKSSIVVPGHSGDFVAGSHIPKFTFESVQHDEDALYGALIKNHLSNAPKDGMLLADTKRLKERLRHCINLNFDGSDTGLANLYELWDWQERQSKYIVNSVRAYEQFEVDWWLPLWDVRFVRFWQDVPLALRKERFWFKKWIDRQYSAVVGDSIVGAENLGNAADHSKIMGILIYLVKQLPKPMRNVLTKVWRSRTARKHFLAFEGLISDGDVDSYLDRNYNMIGIYSDLFIKSKW
ncbi:MAG: asparagine synthase-related protein [Pseudomonadota bacterium]